jgi:predicted thioesterase
MTCDLTAGGQSLPVTVTVTSVDGSTVNFDIEVAES